MRFPRAELSPCSRLHACFDGGVLVLMILDVLATGNV